MSQEQRVRQEEGDSLLPNNNSTLNNGISSAKHVPIIPRTSYEDLEYEEEIESLENTVNPHRPVLYIFMLAIVVGGLQLSWSTEFAEGTPFLLSLGISKHTLALIWIAGPLSGSLGHPIVGLFSDISMNPKGRRRPFIISGCAATVTSLFALSYSIDFIELFFPEGTDLDVIKTATIPFAAFAIYLIDFSIAVIQASSRAYIVDNVPTHQQQLANAFAAVLIGCFNIIGFFLGSINLPRWFPFLGTSQFKVLAAIACLALVLCTASSLTYIKERDPTTDPVIKIERERTEQRLRDLGLEGPNSFGQMVAFLYKQTINSVIRLSPQVKLVCLTEFFAWIGYFPMLFYTTTYVGELYKYEFWHSRDPSLPSLTGPELQLLDEESIRRGSMALLAHSIVSFTTDILLPLLTKPVKGPTALNDQSSTAPMIVQKIESLRQRYIPNLTVRLTWTISHIIFILCMFSTFFIHTSTTAIFMFGVLGIPWGTALWTPFVLIAEEISRIKEAKLKLNKFAQDSREIDSSNANDETLLEMKETILKFEEYEHEAGIILGIHNFFVAAPQMVSSLTSSLLFAMFSYNDSSGGGVNYDGSIAWVFRIGGIAAILAWWWSLKVKKDEELWNEVEVLGNHLGESA